MIVTSAAARVAVAEPHIESLTVDEVTRSLERGEAILIDLREPGERILQGVIRGALSATWGMLAFWDALTEAYHRSKRVPNGRVVLYCAAGVRSAIAADLLQQMGYANVAYLAGGFFAWNAAGRPVETA